MVRLTFDFAPGTSLGEAEVPGYRRDRHVAVIGHGVEDFDRAVASLFAWGFQRNSGIAVLGPDARDAPAVHDGQDARIHVPLLGPIVLSAPVRVLLTVRESSWAGFAYGTLPGHPERGEESFLVRLDAENRVLAEVRALSRPAMPYALAAPVGRAYQRRFMARYLRALTR